MSRNNDKFRPGRPEYDLGAMKKSQKEKEKEMAKQNLKARSVTNQVRLPKASEVNREIKAAERIEKNKELVEKTQIHQRLDAQKDTQSVLEFQGEGLFRWKIIFSLLSGKTVRINDIRLNDPQKPGIREYEVNFLRFVDRITTGTTLNINKTGTSVKFVPGILIGGVVEHDCTLHRCVGYLLEAALLLGPFCKYELKATFKNCVTNSDTDLSCDLIRAVTIRQLQNFGFGSVDIIGVKSPAPDIKVTKRGAPPLGGGEVEFTVPLIKTILPCTLVDPGMIRRIRGLSYTTKCSASFSQRMITSARGVLNGYIGDIHIYSDAFTKRENAGNSPGYSIALAAESSTGCVLSSQRTASTSATLAQQAQGADLSKLANGMVDNLPGDVALITPEDVGRVAGKALLEEVSYGGCVDSVHQGLYLFFMALGPDQQVSRVRFGQLTPQSIYILRLLKEFWGITFQLTPDVKSSTVLVSCVGIGYQNMNRKAI